MNPFAPEETTQVTPPPFVQKPGAYYSLDAAARRNTTPFLTRLKAWLTNRPGEALDESTGGREMLSPDVFYKQAIEAPATQRPGRYDWLDSLAHTLTGAMIMRGGVEIPEWAQGHPMIKRYGALKERGILNEAEYEQGVKEQIAKLGSTRERMANTEPSSVIDQLEQMAKTGAQQTDRGTPVEALPLVSPGRGGIREAPSGWDEVPGGVVESYVPRIMGDSVLERTVSEAFRRLESGDSVAMVSRALNYPDLGMSNRTFQRVLNDAYQTYTLAAMTEPDLAPPFIDFFVNSLRALSPSSRSRRPRTVAPAEFPTEAQNWSVADNPIRGAVRDLSELGLFDLPTGTQMQEFSRRFRSTEGTPSRRRVAVPPDVVNRDSSEWWSFLSEAITTRANNVLSTRSVDVDRAVGRYISDLFGISVRDGMRVYRDFSSWSGRGDPARLLEDAYSAMWYARYRPRNPR